MHLSWCTVLDARGWMQNKANPALLELGYGLSLAKCILYFSWTLPTPQSTVYFDLCIGLCSCLVGPVGKGTLVFVTETLIGQNLSFLLVPFTFFCNGDY